MLQSFNPHWGEGQEVGKPDWSRVQPFSRVALSLGGRLGLGAEGGNLRSDSKEDVCPVLALVRDLANPERVFHHSCRNK